MSIEAQSTATTWPCTNEEYHADLTAISNSQREQFRQCRKTYHAQYVARTLPSPEPTKDMLLGTYAHTAILEPERWLSEFVIAPKVDRRTKQGKADWEAFCDEAEGKTLIDEETRQIVNGMREAVMATPKARAIIEAAGEVEHTIRWTCPETGLPLKSRRDKWVESINLLADLKTTPDASPDAFARKVAAFGYHRQAAFYQAGHHELTGELPHFAFIAVSKKPPHRVGLFWLDDAAQSLGAQQVLADLHQMAECRESGNWLTESETDFVELTLPRYAFYEDDE